MRLKYKTMESFTFIPTTTIQVPTTTIQVPTTTIQVPTATFQVPTTTFQVPYVPKTKSTICFATMCKNEAHCIIETLESVYKYNDIKNIS